MRSPTSPSAPVVTRGSPHARLLADLTLSVVTPMFGGGVETGQVDTGNPIRAASIRGHLRFWWRACNVAGFKNLGELHAAESALWGSAASDDDPKSGPGAIAVRVTEVAKGTPFAHRDGPGYVMFPFVEKNNEGRQNIRFRLQLTLMPHAGKNRTIKPADGAWPDAGECKRAAEGALWAWIAFGGIGSRTRRGCGSLRCTGVRDDAAKDGIGAELFQVSNNTSEWFVKRFLAHVARTDVRPAGSPIAKVPSLTGSRIACGPSGVHPTRAWESSINLLKRFLQDPHYGRNPGTGSRPGQSRWPEVSAARGLLSASSTGPGGKTYAKALPGKAGGNDFPRADLGLPRLLKLSYLETGTLQGADRKHARMASPIILKALPVSDNSAIPIAVLLSAPHVWDTGMPGVELSGTPLTTGPMTTSPPSWPWTDLPPNVVGAVSARDAFMEFADTQNGWGLIP